MSRMKISGQTQGKLVFSYDIREGHIEYKKLIPALNKKLVEMGVEAVAEDKELENVVGEVLYRVNEFVFDNFYNILERKEDKIDVKNILEDVIKEICKE